MAEKKTGDSALRKAAKEMGKRGGPARDKKLTKARKLEEEAGEARRAARDATQRAQELRRPS